MLDIRIPSDSDVALANAVRALDPFAYDTWWSRHEDETWWGTGAAK